MSKQELLKFIVSEIEKQGFEIFSNDEFPIPAIANVRKKLLVQNPTTVTPFKLAHELSHIINKDYHRRYDYDALNPQEVRANREAVLLLWQVFENNGGTYDYFTCFVEMSGCPYDLAYTIVSKEYNEMLEAITEIYEDDILLNIEKSQLHDYAIDYISSFDVIETINIYNFLDFYHLDHDLYDMAKTEIGELLGVA